MDNREWFNNLATKWDTLMTAGKEEILQDILGKLAIPENGAVLDVGTGTGVLVPWLREAVGPGGKLVAFDYAGEMIDRAMVKFGKQAEFLVADVHSLNFPEETFDRVICNSAFPHFSDKPRAMAEMSRVLKRGGFLYIMHASPREALNRFHSSLDGPVSGDMLPDEQEMAGLSEAAGLEDIDIKDGPVFYLLSARKAG